MLRTFNQLKNVFDAVTTSLHMVEVSPTLRSIQYNTICPGTIPQDTLDIKDEKNNGELDPMNGMTECGRSVSWHKTLDTVPKKSFSFFVGHEFFDALPVHKFNRVNGKWKEVFIDVCSKNGSEFQFVLSPHATIASKSLIKVNLMILRCSKLALIGL